MRALIRCVVSLSVIVVVSLAASRVPANADPGIGTDIPSGLPPADILEPMPGVPAWSAGPGVALGLPVTSIPGGAGGLGLPAGVDVDAISYGDDAYPPAGPWHIAFSVTAASAGHPGAPIVVPPTVFLENTVNDTFAEGDIWSSANMPAPPLFGFAAAFPHTPACAIGSNRQLADEDGFEPAGPGYPRPLGLGLVPPDNIDSLEMLDNAFADAVAPFGVPEIPVFFSVTAATAALMPLVPGPGLAPPALVSGADVLVWAPGLPPPGIRRWAAPAALGLVFADDIDALGVDYLGAPIAAPGGYAGAPEAIMFSLAAGSPSNAALGSICFGPGTGGPADIYADVGGPTFPILDAENLGVGGGPRSGTPPDDIDAIDVLVESGVDTDGDMLDNAIDFDNDGDGCADLGEVAIGKLPLSRVDFPDADNSKTIGFGDFIIMLAAWGSSNPPGTPPWDPRADFDGSTTIGFGDFVSLLANWLDVCP